MGRVRVHWRSYTRDPLVASFRYRCLVPAMGLDRAGLAVNRFSVTGQDACLESETDVLVLVKTLTRVDLDLARRAKELGRKVVLDLCDNAFFWPGFYTERLDTKHHFHYSLQAHLLRELATVVDAIVVPTTALEKRLREEFPALRILVIPDPMESESIRSSLRGRRWLLALNSYFATPYVALKYGIWAGVPFFAQGLSRRFGEKLWKLVSPAFSALSRGFEALANYFRSTVSRTWPGIDEKKLRQAEALPPAKHPSFRWPAPKDVEGKRRLVWFGNCGIPGAFGITELKLIEPELSSL